MNRRPLVVAVGHFPPPLHGMAVATERLVSMIADRADVRILVISVAERHGVRRHFTRMARTLGAILRMCLDRRRSGTLYAGSDAGLGMSYTLAIVAAGRLLGYRVFLHHHSAAYVNERSALMAAIVRSGGGCSTHVLSCAQQARAFETRYSPALPTMVVPISFALSGVDGARKDLAGTGPDQPGFVLGHLSNLSAEKGLERVFSTLHAARASGLDARLVLAGPPATAADQALLEELLEKAQPHAVYRGPVDAGAKCRFFDEIDVFLFPSLYRHESFGLVAGEAMLAGVPVITHQAGCLDADYVGGAGLVLPWSEDFVEEAVRQLRCWAEDPEDLHASAALAASRARAAHEEGLTGAAALVDLIVCAGPTTFDT